MEPFTWNGVVGSYGDVWNSLCWVALMKWEMNDVVNGIQLYVYIIQGYIAFLKYNVTQCLPNESHFLRGYPQIKHP